MGHTCNGICQRLKAPPIANYLKYKLGYKRCSLCEEYFVVENIMCPCCSTRLRNKPRSKPLAEFSFRTEGNY